MKKSEIVDILKKFDLTDYESNVYSTLVFLGPSKVRKISKESGVPKSKIYGVLDDLLEKHMVRSLEISPKQFRAIPPKVALNNLLDERRIKIKNLKEKIEVLDKFLKPLSPKEEVLQGIWVAKGKRWTEFINKVSDMYDRSDKYAYCISRDFSLSPRLANAVKSCKERGVEIKTVTMREIDGSNYERAKWFNDHGVRIRMFKTEVHPRIIVADGREVLLRLDHEPRKRKKFSFTSVWSEDAALANVMDTYVKNLWKRARKIDFDKIGKNLQEGKNEKL